MSKRRLFAAVIASARRRSFPARCAPGGGRTPPWITSASWPRRFLWLPVTHHPSAQGRRGHHLVAGVEEDLQQPDRRLVPDHRLPRRRLGGIALQDAGADLPSVLHGRGSKLVHQALAAEALAYD